MTGHEAQPARASGEFAIGGDLPIVRLGYGSMQIPGPGVWGKPLDHDEVIRVLRRAVDLGVTFVDTADSYGPEVSERLIREALHPYPQDLVIATKAGLTRPGRDRWERNGKPEHLKAQAEKSLRLLGFSCTASIPTSRLPNNWGRWSSFRPKARSDVSGFQRSRRPRSKPRKPSRRS
jgi:hypothetical protein